MIPSFHDSEIVVETFVCLISIAVDRFIDPQAWLTESVLLVHYLTGIELSELALFIHWTIF